MALEGLDRAEFSRDAGRRKRSMERGHDPNGDSGGVYQSAFCRR
jgi:hypothetical protein